MDKDPCPYLVKYSLDVLKMKTKVLDISNRQKRFYKDYYRIKSTGDMENDPFSWNKRIRITVTHKLKVSIGKILTFLSIIKSYLN